MINRTQNRYLLMAPKRCAVECTHVSERLLPYLAAVPKNMSLNYPELITNLGVKESFSLNDYKSILIEIQTRFAGEPLDEKHLDIVLDLTTNCIFNALQANHELSEEFPIPNANGILCSSKILCFNNCVWMLTGNDKSKYCHDAISHKIAEALGLKTIRQDLLKKHQLSIPFGQREKLVNRIKRILSGYHLSEDILKELLQNADDSGASVVHFIKDSRKLPDQKVLEDSWKPLQGPSLCVYNNKSFTKQDLIGIQNLGGGSKSEDPTKTGQYGVGFNCVYHCDRCANISNYSRIIGCCSSRPSVHRRQ